MHTYDFSNFNTSIYQGKEYEALDTPIRIVNEWNIQISDRHLYAEAEIYDKIKNEWVFTNLNYYGAGFNASSLSEFEKNAHIRAVQSISKYGFIDIQLDRGFGYKEIIDPAFNWRLLDEAGSYKGSRQDDIINSENGNDIIYGNEGNDLINGGGGYDVAGFSGHRNDYSLALAADSQLVISSKNNSYVRDGIDKITGIEEIRFGNSSYLTEDLRREILNNSTPILSKNVTRLFNQITGKHLFSGYQHEIDFLVGGGYGWVDEGFSYSIPSEPTTEIYRFVDSGKGKHFYTSNKNERDSIISQMPNLKYEGVAYNAYSTDNQPENSIAVVRFYNLSTNSHLYSTDSYEQSLLNRNSQWINEGIAWYADPISF